MYEIEDQQQRSRESQAASAAAAGECRARGNTIPPQQSTLLTHKRQRSRSRYGRSFSIIPKQSPPHDHSHPSPALKNFSMVWVFNRIRFSIKRILFMIFRELRSWIDSTQSKRVAIGLACLCCDWVVIESTRSAEKVNSTPWWSWKEYVPKYVNRKLGYADENHFSCRASIGRIVCTRRVFFGKLPRIEAQHREMLFTIQSGFYVESKSVNSSY